ncbi:MAG: hypothetical protein AAFP84_12320 [Actinomycetota bacterium]
MEFVRRHAWWVLPTIIVSAVVGAVWAGGLIIVYAVANAVGTWLSVDQPGFGPRSPRSWLAWATIALLPVGLVAVFGTKSAIRPTESALSGRSADDPDGSAPHIAQPSAGGPMGQTGLG